MENLYHAQVYMPEIARGVAFAAMVRPTPHARAAAASDRYGAFTLPTVVDTRNGEIVEAKMENGVVVKIVLRQSYDAAHDVVLVIDPRPSQPVLITAWLNEKGDRHETLNADRYAKN